MDKQEKIKKFYDLYYDSYDKHMIETKHYKAQEKILNLILDQIREPILDLACGTGFLIGKLSDKFSKIFGNDFSINMIEATKKKYNFPITNDNAEILDSYKNKFKTIISCNLFFYIQNRDKAIKRWKELLEDDGKIIFIEEYPFIKPKSGEMDEITKELMSLIDPVSLKYIEEIMNKNGFSLIKKVETKIDDQHSLYGLVFSL